MAITIKDIQKRNPVDTLRVLFEIRERNANIPRDFRYPNNPVSIEDSPTKEEPSDIYILLKKYVETFVDRSHEIKSLYLWSTSPGTGKTSTAAALLNEYIIAHIQSHLIDGLRPAMVPAYFLDVNELQTLFNKFNRPNVPQNIAQEASESYYERLEIASKVNVLVADDIGVRWATEAFRGDLHSLINERVANKRPTIYTSNLALEEMAHVFDARLYDRMRHQCLELAFTGESKRGRK